MTDEQGEIFDEQSDEQINRFYLTNDRVMSTITEFSRMKLNHFTFCFDSKRQWCRMFE